MTKKIIKLFFIIVLAILLIVSNKIDSYALTDKDWSTLREGDKLKIIKDSFEYKDFGVLFTNNYKEDKEGLSVKKGDIVEIVKNPDKNDFVTTDVYGFGTKVKWLYYVKRIKDNKTFWMIQENLEKYKGQFANRPSTLTDFMKKYNITSSMTDQEFNKMYRSYITKATKEDAYNKTLIESNSSYVTEQSDLLGKKASKLKKELEDRYKDFCNYESIDYIPQTTEDNRFIVECLDLSKAYLKAEKTSSIVNENDSSAEKFDKAVKQYNSATDSATKDAAYKIITDEWRNLTKAEKEKRQDDFNKIAQKEEKRNNENYDNRQEATNPIYTYPGQSKSSSAGTLDDMIGDADKFVDSAKSTAISASSLQSFSKRFYNIFLTIGIIVSVLVGSILGIKFMIGGIEEKAHMKELLIPYVVGCIAVFGAFAIWKLVVTILSNSFL